MHPCNCDDDCDALSGDDWTMRWKIPLKLEQCHSVHLPAPEFSLLLSCHGNKYWVAAVRYSFVSSLIYSEDLHRVVVMIDAVIF